MLTRILAAPAVVALAVALTPAATAAPDSAAGRTPAYVTSQVVDGSIRGVPGNRHQVVIDKSQRDRVGGWIRSWSCPEGAAVTMTFVSSRCDHRLTQDLRPRSGTQVGERLSSTTRSAVVTAPTLVGVNRSTGHVRPVPVDLRIIAADSSTLTGEAGAHFWNPSLARGTVGGAAYRDAKAWVGYR